MMSSSYELTDEGIPIDIAFIDSYSLFNRNVLTELLNELQKENEEKTDQNWNEKRLTRYTTNSDSHQFDSS